MTISVGSSSAFPQTGANRSIEALAAQLARYVGGESDGDILALAKTCIHEAVQVFNRVAWKFNRMQQSITLTTEETYTVNSTFRTPLRSYLLDSDGKRRSQPLRYVPFSSWNEVTGATNFDTSIPELYTVRNAHADGLLTVWPPPAATLTYPTVQLNYHKWIVVPADSNGALDVPRDVEQAILDEAKARIFEAKRGAERAQLAQRAAERAYLWVSRIHRDFEEIPIYGAGI